MSHPCGNSWERIVAVVVVGRGGRFGAFGLIVFALGCIVWLGWAVLGTAVGSF